MCNNYLWRYYFKGNLLNLNSLLCAYNTQSQSNDQSIVSNCFKGATISYFMIYSSVVIILLNTDLDRPLFSTYSFCSVFFVCSPFKLDVMWSKGFYSFCVIIVYITCVLWLSHRSKKLIPVRKNLLPEKF